MKDYRSILFVLIFSLFCVYTQAQAQQFLSDPLTVLKEGNLRFYSGQTAHPHQDMHTVKQLTAGQSPFAVVVCCSDSRVSPEVIFDQGLGDLFVVRTAGNVMGDYEEGSIEYAIEHLHTSLVVVLGHTSCGAIKAYVDAKEGTPDAHAEHGHESKPLGHVQAILTKLDSEEEMADAFHGEGAHYDAATRANVAHGVKQLQESDPILSKLFKEGKINIVGAIYHLDKGVVSFF